MKKSFYLIVFCLICNTSLFAQQNQIELVIENLGESEAYDIKGGAECHPGDIIVTIKSDIPSLTFDSNIMDIKGVNYNANKGEYVFCHSKESFWLTIGSSKHISKKTYVDGAKTKYAYRVVEKAALGKVYFKTTPNNALVDFGFSGQSPQLTGLPIEMNSGEYKVRISKVGYLSIDTAVVVPSDGTIRQLDIVLKPVFAKIILDIKPNDNSQFQVYPQMEIDTAHINMAELFNNTRQRSFDDESTIQYFKLYSGGVIPVPQGTYSVTINTPGFRTYNTRITTAKGSITTLTAKLQPIAGYLTVLDAENAMDAKVYMDDELIGKIPVYKHKTRIGAHIVRIEKEGYLASEKEYRILAEEGKEQDLSVTMTVYKQFMISSSPAGAEILIDGQREGFTPQTISMNKGEHEIIIRKNGYLDYKKKITIDDKVNLSLDSVKCELEFSTPIMIKSEQEGLQILIKRKKDIVFSGVATPAEISLPKGKYQLTLLNKNYKTFVGTINHNGKNKVSAPTYSKGTFTTLVGDYYLQKPKATTGSGENNPYSLLVTAQFGRFNLAPGLSTAILKGSAFEVTEGYKGKKETIDTDKEKKYGDYMPAATCLFLNGEFRAGVSVLKNLDVAALGSYAYYPSLTKFLPMSHADGQEMFLGVEITSRISVLNANVKIGKETYKGNFNFYLPTQQAAIKEGDFVSDKFTVSNFTITVGFTLGQSVTHSNNMFRILKKPLVTGY